MIRSVIFILVLLLGAAWLAQAGESLAPRWSQTHPAQVSGQSELLTATTVDAAGNVYVATVCADTSTIPAGPSHLLKYAAADGALLWDHFLPNGVLLSCLAVDAAGQLAAAGSTLGNYATNIFHGNLFAARYSAANGAPIWEKNCGGSAGHTLALDGQGNLFVNGRVSGSELSSTLGSGVSGVVIIIGPAPTYSRTMKLAASDGAVLWANSRALGYYSSIQFTAGIARDGFLATDPLGNVILSRGNYLAKYAAQDGQLSWEQTLRSPVATALSSGGLKVDQAGDAVVISADNSAQAAQKFSGADGHSIWWWHEDFAAGENAFMYGLTLNAAGDVNLLGSTSSYGTHVLHLAGSSGRELWRQNLTDGTAFLAGMTSTGRLAVASAAVGSVHYMALLDDTTGDLFGEFREAPWQAPGTLPSFNPTLVMGPAGTCAVVRQAGSDVGVTLFEPVLDAPTVTPTGESSLTLDIGTPYTEDAGATATDAAGDPLNATAMPQLMAAGTSLFPLRRPGVYHVNYTATDARGIIGAGSRTVRIVDHAAPEVTAPDLTVELKEAGANGPGYSIPAGTTVDAYPAITATDGDEQLAVSYDVLLSHRFPVGATPVRVTVTDRSGNATTVTFTVRIRDSTPPWFYTSPYYPVSVTAGRMPDLRNQVVAYDLQPVTITQSPAPGAWVNDDQELRFTATDASGNADSRTVDLYVQLSLSHEAKFQTGGYAPGAGLQNGPPSNSYLTHFGVPAIDQSGNIAFTGAWAGEGGAGRGLFTQNRCIAKRGGPVPGLARTSFAAFQEPVIHGGHVGFLTTLAGAGSGTAVCSNAPTGQLVVLARAGMPAPGISGGRFVSFRAVALAGSAVAFQAGAVDRSGRAVNGIWALDATHGLTLLLRDGVSIGGKKITTLASFLAGTGSPGQGRGWLLAPGDKARVQAVGLCTDGTQVLLTGSFSTAPTLELPSTADLGFRGHGVPTRNAAGTTAWLGTRSATAGAPAPFGQGIFDHRAPNPAANPVALVGGAASLRALKDPLLTAQAGDSLLFSATVAPPGEPARTTLFYQERDDRAVWPQPLELTSTGADAVDLDGYKFTSFTSLALTDRGPIFIANAAQGRLVDQGVWAVGADGRLRLLFHRGGQIAAYYDPSNPELRSFTLLNAVAGSQGVGRNYNEQGQLVWRATFKDGTEAIVLTQIP
jgi:hypothetical protein